MKALINSFKANYCNIICYAITLFSFLAFFLFPNSIPRLAEAVVDLLTSVLYYLVELIAPNHNFVPATVVELQSWLPFAEVWTPIRLFPNSLEQFLEFWSEYFELIFTLDYVKAYFDFIGDIFYNLSRMILIFLPVIIYALICLNKHKNKQCTKRGLKSKQLMRFELFYQNKVLKFVGYVTGLLNFISEHEVYLILWSVLWMLHFNVFSVVVSAIGYFFYFAVSWELPTLYTQILKLQLDLTPMLRFVPIIIWLLLGIFIYNRICRSAAFNLLYYAERCNRAVLRERGIVNVVYGAMGTGKTQLITAMALSAEQEMFDQAYKIMLEKDLQFPNFNWQLFRDDIDEQINKRQIYDLNSCKNWVRSYVEPKFAFVVKRWTAEEYRDILKAYPGIKDRTFGYDYDHYSMTYNDELKISTLFDSLESYAQAYMIFITQTTLLFTNYSIRVDSMVESLGNFPQRNGDFFHREPRLIKAHANHSHIIDFDMLKLGRKLEHTLNLSYGVFVITEIDKERKNALELKEYKIKDDEANQKNDLFNACLMMCRHAAVVDNRVFIRIICDLQRPEAWGAGGRELGEVICITEKEGPEPTLPFFSPYWIMRPLFQKLKDIWEDFYTTFIVNRSDETLTVFLMKNVVSKINNHFDKLEGQFGKITLHLQIQSGTLEGEIKEDKWHILTKKDRSNRYRTDCLEQVFKNDKTKVMHVDDFVTYAGSLASQDELLSQNSYFQNDIRKMKGV